MTQIDKPLVSIITSSYNASGSIERCIRSVTGQTYENVEHIIIDGSSDDGTVEIIERYNEEVSYWLSEPDHGIYDAWNKGVTQVNGEWVLFLGADDYLHDHDVLARMSAHLQSAWPTYSVVYGVQFRVTPDGTNILRREGVPWEKLKKSYNYPTLHMPPQTATFHHISLFNGVHSFDMSYRYTADARFLLAALLQKDPLFVDSIVTCFSTGGVTSSSASVLERWLERNRISRELGIKVPLGKKAKSFGKALSKGILFKVFGARSYHKMARFVRGLYSQVKRHG